MRAAEHDPLAADTLFGMLSRAASKYGDRIALQICRSGHWTRLSYRQLHAAAEAWGRALAAAGLSQGDRALLVSESCPEWGVAYFAIISQGAAAVPLDPQLSGRDISAIAGRTRARLWLLSPSVYDRVGETLATDPSRPQVFLVDRFAHLPDQPAQAAPTGDADAPWDEPDAGGRVASIPFTSGTTLAPKGVPLSHRNFLSNVRSLLRVVDFSSSDALLSVLPMHHVLEFTGGFLAPLCVGATVTYAEKLTPKVLLESMQSTGTSVLISVPRLLVLLVKAVRARADSSSPLQRRVFAALVGLGRFCNGLARQVPATGSSLRRLRAILFRPAHRRLGGRMRIVVSGGAALPPDVYTMLDLMGFTVCEGYGLTETAPVLTVNPPPRPRCGTVGPAIPDVELRIADPDANGIGEVLARGPCVFAGYLDDEQATQRAFCGEWFRTGDLGRLDEDGYLVLSGRADDVIVTGGGKNVYPVEIEWLYRDAPHVKEMCVIGVPDHAGAGEAVHAVIVLDEPEEERSLDGRKREVESALSAISRQLPSHQRIRGVHFWEGDLPRTATLKVKRRQLRDALRSKAGVSQETGSQQ
jgi:long-chain acyl-CoA synthetase